MDNKKKLAKDLEKHSKKFLNPGSRKQLLASLKGNQTKWLLWSSRMKNLFKNLNRLEAAEFSGLLLLLEKKPSSRFYQNKLKEFLIDKTEFYRYYDFSLEKKTRKSDRSRQDLWINRFFRILISRSFVGILLILLVVGFILWFYLDRQSCVEFVKMIGQPFLKAIR